ncbi:MAG: DEAD/DEAH box helicase [Anaerolineae bacterium]|nr:DEAD/DEAH box helicase [Anaerolineae bacterium]
MNFKQFNLDSRLDAGITRAGYQEPTPIQSAVIPVILAGDDVIATAQTGTGKTAAFVLPILHHLLDHPRNQTRAVIITPTRELAEQIHQNIRLLAGGTRIRSAAIYGGVSSAAQIKALQEGVDIIVACPGRLLDLIESRHSSLKSVDFVVLDEADRMLDMGFLPSVRRILKVLPGQRQTMLFSATFPDEIEALAAQQLYEPKRIAIGISRPAHTVSHALYSVPQHLKTQLLLELLKQTDTHSVLIFTRTKHRASRLSRQIQNAGFRVTSLHSDRTQNQRQAALNGFKSGHYQVMVATDIAARGLDVENLSHVINFDMPDTADAYIHRIGRTGRAQHNGDAFTLVTPEDSGMVKTIEKILGQPLPRQTLEDFDYSAPPAPSVKPAETHQPRQHRTAVVPKTNRTNNHRPARFKRD